MRKSENCIINKYGAFGRAVFLIILSGCISTATIAQNIIVDESGDDMLDASTSSSGKIRQEKTEWNNILQSYEKSFTVLICSETVFSYLQNCTWKGVNYQVFWLSQISEYHKLVNQP